jgi:hypothetical protein
VITLIGGDGWEGGKMTEEEWLECREPQPMLEFLHGPVSDRKLRLFIASYCRRNLHLFHDERFPRSISVAECFADGRIDDTELSQSYIEMSRIWTDSLRPAASERWQSVRVTSFAIMADTCRRAVRPTITSRIIGLAAEGVIRVLAEGIYDDSLQRTEGQVQVQFLHEIFGNPFRLLAINPAWLTSTVVSLASVAYEQRNLPSGGLDAKRLGVLADALEDAGCTNADILWHLRSAGVHVRGCWALDLLLSKE